jgi:hypothetical protein
LADGAVRCLDLDLQSGTDLCHVLHEFFAGVSGDDEGETGSLVGRSLMVFDADVQLSELGTVDERKCQDILNAVGADEALGSGPGIYSVDTTRISCDYYRLLDGDESAARAFRGEYMAQYSWAEETCGWLVTNLQGKGKRS